MLTVKCAACKRKLWKYDKIGKGDLLRCHKDRISRKYEIEQSGQKVMCLCGKEIGIDKGSHIKMIRKSFVYTGTKRTK
ncbi:MAG: hypothetical protein DWQ04_22485 [Chloroflexi bacterium]|nr:MAG: hypothetical protein DWQ04_22485 [Chloroflexota bacterium]